MASRTITLYGQLYDQYGQLVNGTINVIVTETPRAGIFIDEQQVTHSTQIYQFSIAPETWEDAQKLCRIPNINEFLSATNQSTDANDASNRDFISNNFKAMADLDVPSDPNTLKVGIPNPDTITGYADLTTDTFKHTVTDYACQAGKDPDLPDYMVGIAAAFDDASSLISPLVLDLNGDGIHLTSVAGSRAFFDLAANGFARQTGWIGSTDGFLAVDTNENGKIDNINELFGNATTGGFQVLESLDSNSDDVIDADDADFSTLRVWIDANENGITDIGELKSLGELGITSLSLGSTSENIVDRQSHF